MIPFKFILLLGKSGSGKGTQAELLAKKFNLVYLSTGNLLRKRLRQNDFIGNHIINEGSSHRARIPEIIYLNGRRPMGENARAIILSETLQVDSDLHLKFMHKPCYLVIGVEPNVVELIKGLDEA